MENWDWHDFALRKNDARVEQEHDEDRYTYSEEILPTMVLRNFFLSMDNEQDKVKFTIAFLKIESSEKLDTFSGGANGTSRFDLPASGAWAVSFGRTDTDDPYAKPVFNGLQSVKVIRQVACAVYDHYNVSKAGLYCWYAANAELKELYDVALGLSTRELNKGLKFIPKTKNHTNLGQSGRCHVIKTQYY